MPKKKSLPKTDPSTINPNMKLHPQTLRELLTHLSKKDRALMLQAIRIAFAHSQDQYNLLAPKLPRLQSRLHNLNIKERALIHAIEARYEAKIQEILKPLPLRASAVIHGSTNLDLHLRSHFDYEARTALYKFRNQLDEKSPTTPKPVKLPPEALALLDAFKLSLQKALPPGPSQPTPSLEPEKEPSK